MANKKISQLTAAATLTGTEIVPIVQGTSTVKTTVQDIANLAPASPAELPTQVIGNANKFLQADGIGGVSYQTAGGTTVTSALFKILLPTSGGGTLSFTEIYNTTGRTVSIYASNIGPYKALDIGISGTNILEKITVDSTTRFTSTGALIIADSSRDYTYQNSFTQCVIIAGLPTTVWTASGTYVYLNIRVYP